jgi:hypothetical protein
MRLNKIKAYLKLALAIILLIIFSFVILPGMAAVPFFNVVQHNLCKDLDATPYFYTEVENFEKYERAVKLKLCQKP